MDKIEKKWPDNMELKNKVNELVEGYEKKMKRLEGHIIYHRKYDK